MRLMETRLIEIIRQKRSNDKSIHLYGTGEYGVAFEVSAYLLCRMFFQEVLSVISHASNPFPVIMASIPDEKLRSYTRQHIPVRDKPDYKKLLVSKLSAREYHKWHEREVREFM